MFINATPPEREPVKPTALICGCSTKAEPTSRPEPYINENTPAGMPVFFAAAVIARPTSSAVPGCAECAFTITGQPAARAEAVSPPATENANGKLEAPNTATGPNGMYCRRRSLRGRGVRSGIAGSMRTSRYLPARTTPANKRNWPMVRPRSPSIRACGRPDSAIARCTKVSPRARISSAMVSRKVARASGVVAR